ncbi:MAG: sigma-70 family RNA polymerase sigma factor [Planctomycetes bacterium]|nr:sigma-70 family RNA polymerase sigma factor [Planctomycetota bacterium]
MDTETRNQVERAATGDPAAFETLIRKYARLVYSQAYAVVRHRQEAEDVAQETFAKAYRAMADLKSPALFPSWICSIARHRALDALRKRVLEDDGREPGDRSDPRCGDPGKELEAAEMRDRIFEALDQLPENHRSAVVLRYMEGMDHKDIQEALGISDGSLRGILGRSLQALRTALEPWVKGQRNCSECGLKKN